MAIKVGTMMTVADLTEEHVGWRIQTGPMRAVRSSHHRFRLVGLRTWTYGATTTVGLVDGDMKAPGIYGLERAYDPATSVELIKPETAKAKRLAKVAK